MDPETLLKAAWVLADHNIQFSFQGGFHVSPEDAVRAVTDPEQLEADCHDVTIEAFRAFRVLDWQCKATTKKGERCRNEVLAAGRYQHCPANFDPGAPSFNYCKTHM